MEKSVKSSAINYGLKLGLILTLATVAMYAINIDLFTEWYVGIVLFVVSLVVGIMSSVKAKNILGGYISFKQAFSSYFITMAVGTLIATVIGIVIFTFVDPEAADALNEKILVMTKETMERFGAPQETIIEALKEAEGKNNFSVNSQLMAWVWRLVIYSIFGLISSLIIKKAEDNA